MQRLGRSRETSRHGQHNCGHETSEDEQSAFLEYPPELDDQREI